MSTTYLDFSRFGAAEALIYFNSELSSHSRAIPFQHCSSKCSVHAAVLLIVHVHWRKPHNMLFQ